MDKKELKRIVIWYLIIVAMLLLVRIPRTINPPFTTRMTECVNLSPFRYISKFINELDSPVPKLAWLARLNLLGNVAIFVPLGWLLPTLWDWAAKFYRTMFLAALYICSLEIMQAILLVGKCDIDDLILNLWGVMFGYIIFYSVKKAGLSE